MSGSLDSDKPTIFTATLRQLGRITIPDEMRTIHALEKGCIIEFKILSIQRNTEKNPKRRD